MGQMMNVVQIPRRFVTSDWGGTETVVLETCKRLLMFGHQTEILCPAALAECDEEQIGGVQVRRSPYFYPYLGLNDQSRQLMDMRGGNLFSFHLWRKLHTYPELYLIHLHTSKRLGGIARHVAQKRGIPYVVSLHGGLNDVPAEEARAWTQPTAGTIEWGKALGWWVGSRRVMDDAAAILCVGQRERELTQERYPNKRVLHLPNGVDLAKFEKGDGSGFRRKYDIPDDRFLAATVARIDPQKNQKLAVKALDRLVKTSDSNTHLLLIGHVTNEGYRAELNELIKQSGCENRVTLITGLDPSSNDLINAYHAADLFVLPSNHEPFGIVILEAWAAGLPVVATDVGGVSSLVDDGNDGILVQSKDDESLARVIGDLERSTERCNQLAARGFLKARDEYSWDSVTQRLISIYEEVRHEHAVCC